MRQLQVVGVALTLLLLVALEAIAHRGSGRKPADPRQQAAIVRALMSPVA